MDCVIDHDMRLLVNQMAPLWLPQEVALVSLLEI